jgi:hypothetical protein
VERLTYPGAEYSRGTKKWQRFVRQMYDLQKDWRGKFMDVHAPKQKKKASSKDSHDDYADSLMLLCYLVNRKMIAVETATNPFLTSRGVGNYMNKSAKMGSGKLRRKFDGW